MIGPQTGSEGSRSPASLPRPAEGDTTTTTAATDAADVTRRWRPEVEPTFAPGTGSCLTRADQEQAGTRNRQEQPGTATAQFI
jgi:hypothetical protein